METFDEMLRELNDLKITQTSIDWLESVPTEIFNKYFNDTIETVATNLDVDKHRWYELSTSVISLYNGFLGVRHITDIFSEEMGVEDCSNTLQFFEMEEVEIISYRKK